MSSEIVIKVENISKCYHIYDVPSDRLKQFIFPRAQRWLGRPARNYYREFWALQAVSFEVKKGETLGIIGRNGSGKSTLLQMICGTLHPSSGRIETNGRIAALLELGAGFNGEFTGRENVYLSATLYGLTQAQIDARFERLAAFADIGDFIDQPVKTYSSGMFVRLAFAVIAHVDADILIIDEALAVGDAFFVQKCMRFLREFAQRGTLIFVSHDVGAVLSLCESAIWLQAGKLRAVGSPKDLTNEYMQALYEGQQPLANVTASDAADSAPSAPETATSAETLLSPPLPRDMRADIFNNSNLRNEIELFDFQAGAEGFGAGNARIINVRFEDPQGQPLSWIVGGEEVVLTIDCQCHVAVHGPIVGFIVKDRLGQVLFGDNTWLSTRDTPLSIRAGHHVRARFTFTMPRLPNGDFVISAAIAEGTATEHQQHHWMHDALTFKVHTTSVYTGLVGIPMTGIHLAALNQDAPPLA